MATSLEPLIEPQMHTYCFCYSLVAGAMTLAKIHDTRSPIGNDHATH